MPKLRDHEIKNLDSMFGGPGAFKKYMQGIMYPDGKPRKAKSRSITQKKRLKNKYKITRRKRERIYKRDGRRCVKCKTKNNLTIDHIIPLSKGGTSDDSNLQTMCFDCNNEKGDKIENPN